MFKAAVVTSLTNDLSSIEIAEFKRKSLKPNEVRIKIMRQHLLIFLIY